MQRITSTLTTITDDYCNPWFVNHSLVLCPQMEMNRSELQDAYINEIIDGMDIKDMMALLFDMLDKEMDIYTDKELKEEVKNYYPHLLEE